MAEPISIGGAPTFQILGPLRIWRDGVELNAGPRQQYFLLALLLAREGRPISTDELIDLIWPEHPPASALNVIHKYVGSLRRLLEPDLSVRDFGSYLQRHGNGYLFTAGEARLDLVVFRDLVAAAAAEERPEEALDAYTRALELWQGPAGDGLNPEPAAAAIFARLDAQFHDACTVAADLAVSLGRPERVVPALRLAARMAPLHEPVQASLITTLAAAGQQAEALAVFREVRARLFTELGIAPGQALSAAHRQVVGVSPAAAGPPGLLGRAEELAKSWQAIDAVFAGGTGIVVLEGEPGIGKTTVLNAITAEAAGRGAAVVWSQCLEDEGAPSMWPWVQLAGGLLDTLPEEARERWLAGELGHLLRSGGTGCPDDAARFGLFEAVVAVVGEVAAQRPLVLTIDDLQWADLASLRLFDHLAARLPGGAAIITALRDRAPVPGSALSHTLAGASRTPGHHRLRVGPLGPVEVAELIGRETGRDPDPGTVRDLYDRSSGNPFYVRELARLLGDGGASAEGVPATVRDVVRDRTARLHERAGDLIQISALIGRQVSLSLLAEVAGHDVQTCLDHLEPAVALGLLESIPGDPFSMRFPHDLVRESISEATPSGRAIRLHLRVADALERIGSSRDNVAERIARHLWAAGPLADPHRTATALARAKGDANQSSAVPGAGA
ncbi:BTAD domain-containing putative transcriptional regulator [Herbidospora daliensis]|uniref:BTAD domain-containing putative transcriptional regulator n=1 Tax=Herbidospora daliensis TaxID=295585 RepID=UPI000781ABA6|nr:BTAD domain-containing putative transcriptional regulator [Herbidospora daliensis]